MIQLLLGVTLAIFLILQFVIKRKRRIKTEVVIYESSSVKGRLFSLTKNVNIVGAVLVALILAIGIPGYFSYSSYYQIKNLIDLENYSEARSKIEEYEQGIVPVFRVGDLQYRLKLNWAKSAIESKNWDEAVENLRELNYNDSIPQDLIPKAFIAYYEYINSQIPIYPPKPFDSFTSWNENWYMKWLTDDTFQRKSVDRDIYSYVDYLTVFNVDSSTIKDAYDLYEKLSLINSKESARCIASTTRDLDKINFYLKATRDTNFIAKLYSEIPLIVSKDFFDVKDSLSVDDIYSCRNRIVKLEVELIKYGLNNNISMDKIFSDYREKPDRLWSGDPGLKDYVIKKYFNSTLDSSWGKNDFYSEIKIFRYYLELNEFSQKNKEQKLVQFLQIWNEKEMNKEYSKILSKKRELSAYLDKENRWILPENYWNYLQGKEFNYLRGLSLEQAESHFMRGEYGNAVYWQRYALSLNEYVYFHNSLLPNYYGGPVHWIWTSDYQYFFLSEIIWKMEPTGIKDGYCEALEKSIELGFELASQKWLSNCR